jgi:hypothetical protein
MTYRRCLIAPCVKIVLVTGITLSLNHIVLDEQNQQS